MKFCKLSLLCLLTITLTCTFGSAQESDFAATKAKWVELEKEMKEVGSSIKGGDNTNSEQYQDLIDQANGLIDTMRSQGVEALKKDPNNKDVIRTLLGIMINDANFGREGQIIKLGDQLAELKINPRYFELAAQSSRLSISDQEIFEELGVRRQEVEKNDNPRVKLVTTQGDIVIELFENEAPNTVANFITLAESNFYDGIEFHRVVENFMAQTGCPEGNGSGGPGYNIKCECYEPEARRHFTGSISMAKRTPRDTGGSQFFLCFKRTSFLDGKHTVFGRIAEGWDTLDNLARTHSAQPDGREIPLPDVVKDKIKSVEVIRKRDHKYQVRKVGIPFEEDTEEAKQPPTQGSNNKEDESESKKGADESEESKEGGEDN